MPSEAVRIPVAATFTGLARLPWVALSTNSLAPELFISADTLRYRVLRRRERPLSDIECIDVRSGPGTLNLVFQFRGAALTFVANVKRREVAEQVLRLLPAGVPLSARAQAWRAETA